MLYDFEFYLSQPIRRAMVRRPMKKPKHLIDTKWFLDRMGDVEESMHTLAPKMPGKRGPMTYSNFYRLIHGEWEMSVPQAQRLSELLGVPVETIVRRALGRSR